MRFLVVYAVFTVCLGLTACQSPSKMASKTAFPKNPLGDVLKTLAQDSLCGAVLDKAAAYEIQIIYTQIDRDSSGKPTFTSYQYRVDSTRYFYPASTVKMPLALLALEKINYIKRSGFPRLSRDTPYRLDSLRPFQQTYHVDSTAPKNKPSIAHDIRQIFTVSDNLAYNHLFEFLGRQYINETLRAHGYTRTGIVHRFNFPNRDNRYTSPMVFGDGVSGIYKEGERFDAKDWNNPQHSTKKGKGYKDGQDSLIRNPFEMAKKNWFALTDMEKMIRAVMFPQAVPLANRFDLTPEDYRFLWHYMGIFPRECDYPRYNQETYPDGYVKFFLFGDSKATEDGSIRVFNKVGEAYGTLTDAAYVADFDRGVEFILAATILCNSDGIFNDDAYDYDRIGFPFLAKLGRAVYAHEVKRPKARKPNLEKFRVKVK